MSEAMNYADSVIYSFFVRARNVPYDQTRRFIFFCVIRTCQGSGRQDGDGRILAGIAMTSYSVIDSPIVRCEVRVLRDQFITWAKGGPDDEPYEVYARVRFLISFQISLSDPAFYGLGGKARTFG